MGARCMSNCRVERKRHRTASQGEPLEIRPFDKVASVSWLPHPLHALLPLASEGGHHVVALLQ